MDNPKSKGHAAEGIWRVAVAAGQGFHRAVGAGHREGRSEVGRRGRWKLTGNMGLTPIYFF